jgi:hypothetical protein
MRLFFFRGPGPDFSARDRAVLTLLRPHLHQAYLDAQRRRHPIPRLTHVSGTYCGSSRRGTPTPRSPADLTCREGTVRTHLQNIYERLNVSSRTAAVTHAFPDRIA